MNRNQGIFVIALSVVMLALAVTPRVSAQEVPWSSKPIIIGVFGDCHSDDIGKLTSVERGNRAFPVLALDCGDISPAEFHSALVSVRILLLEGRMKPGRTIVLPQFDRHVEDVPERSIEVLQEVLDMPERELGEKQSVRYKIFPLRRTWS